VEFSWPEEAISFRAALNAFLDASMPKDFFAGKAAVADEESTGVPSSPRWPLVGGDVQHRFSREFAPRLAKAGFLTPHWPPEYGGTGASPWVQLALKEEMWRRGEPRGPQYMNVDWIGPTIMAFGSAEQKSRHLAPMSAGEVVWCQGFSEPESGTDLASLRTRAVLFDDGFTVTGQKIWTSYADEADFCFLAVRTNPDSTLRHKGLSILLVDMTTPGIEVRPIPGIVGDHAFCEVFFDDVIVPAEGLLGELDGGWRAMMYGLSHERVEPRYARSMLYLTELAEIARRRDLLPDAELERRFGEVLEVCEAARMLAYHVVAERAEGKPPSALGNMARLLSADSERAVAALALHLTGLESLVDGSIADAAWRTALSTPVAAGTEEVQLNQIAQRGLGLPRSP
jgi:alkylation response protein AidB-like acyl-CoA dehydrogenase